MSFRFHAHEVATKLKLNGYVRNLQDGRVEILACGQPKDVDSLITWAKRGPPAAHVDGVEITEVKGNFPDAAFYIRRDGGKN